MFGQAVILKSMLRHSDFVVWHWLCSLSTISQQLLNQIVVFMVGWCRKMLFISVRRHLVCPWARRNSWLINWIPLNKTLFFASKAGSTANVVYLYQNDLIVFFVSFVGRLDERAWNIVLTHSWSPLIDPALFRLKVDSQISRRTHIDCIQIVITVSLAFFGYGVLNFWHTMRYRLCFFVRNDSTAVAKGQTLVVALHAPYFYYFREYILGVQDKSNSMPQIFDEYFNNFNIDFD